LTRLAASCGEWGNERAKIRRSCRQGKAGDGILDHDLIRGDSRDSRRSHGGRVATAVAAKQGGRIERGERPAVGEAGGQVGIGDERATEGHQVGQARLEEGFGAGLVVTSGYDDRSAKSVAQFVAEFIGHLGSIVPVGFGKMEISDAQRGQPPGGFQNGRDDFRAGHAPGSDKRRQAHAGALGARFGHHGVGNLVEEAHPVFDAAAVAVCAPVRCTAQKLVDQVAVGAVDFHAIEAGSHGVGRRPAEILDDTGQFGDFQRTRDGAIHHAPDAILADDPDLGVRSQGGGGYGWLAVVKRWVRHAPDMPQLQKHASAGGVNRIGHLAPAVDLGLGINAGRETVALTLAGNLRGFADDQSGGRTLGVILGHQGVGNIAGLGGAAARHGTHDDAARQIYVAQRKGLEQELFAHRGFSRVGASEDF